MDGAPKNDYSYLLWNIKRGINWIHGRGYHWFQQKYLPAINRLEIVANTEDEFELLSDAYYYVGDVHDFNEAPIAAIQAYKKSIKFDPLHAEAYREIGCRYEELGKKKQAIRYLKKALAIFPEEENTKSDLRRLKDVESVSQPLYDYNDIFCKTNEWCAQNKFARVLDVLRHNISLQSNLHRACAFGALDKTEKVVQEWKDITVSNESFSLSARDWFYTYQSIKNSEDFWKLFLSCNNRFEHGVWIYHESLWDSVKSKLKDKAGILRLRMVLKLYAMFQLARIRSDIASMKSFAKEYPKWKEPVQYLKKNGV